MKLENAPTDFVENLCVVSVFWWKLQNKYTGNVRVWYFRRCFEYNASFKNRIQTDRARFACVIRYTHQAFYIHSTGHCNLLLLLLFSLKIWKLESVWFVTMYSMFHYQRIKKLWCFADFFSQSFFSLSLAINEMNEFCQCVRYQFTAQICTMYNIFI